MLDLGRKHEGVSHLRRKIKVSCSPVPESP